VQALEKQAAEKHAHFLAKLEREPKVYEVCEADPCPLLDFWSFNTLKKLLNKSSFIALSRHLRIACALQFSFLFEVSKPWHRKKV